MPYITHDRREAIDAGGEITTPGELSYVITTKIVSYLHREGKSYFTVATIIGVLLCTLLEFYRRVIAPYEVQKIAENGDVFGYDDSHVTHKE